MRGIEESWIKQQSEAIKFFDTKEEWRAIDLYLKATLASRNPDSQEMFKISRKTLSDFLAQHPEYNISPNVINHSFIVIPGEDGKPQIGIMARSKAYTDHNGNRREEGILGYGESGRVNPLKIRNNDGTYSIQALKTIDANSLGLLNNKPYSNEVAIMKKLGKFARLFIRDRMLDKPVPSTIWIKNKRIKNHKAYILQPLITGITLDNFAEEHPSLSEQNKYKIALAILKEVKAMHDKGITHNDLNGGNCFVSYNEKKGECKVSIVDFEFANDDNDQNLKQKDIYALGYLLNKLGIYEIHDNPPENIDAAIKVLNDKTKPPIPPRPQRR